MGCKIMKSVMKKTIAVGTLCTMLMGTAAYGTLAYFQEQETATNVFTTGDLQMDLTETYWMPQEEAAKLASTTIGYDGIVVEKDWNKATYNQATNYANSVFGGSNVWGKVAAENIVPGRTIAKNPAVTIKQGTVPAYVRMTVTVPKSIYELSNLNGQEEAVVNFNINGQWDLLDSDKGDDQIKTLVYEYVGEENSGAKVIEPAQGHVYLPNLFTTITISKEATGEEIRGLVTATNEFNIVVNAYGVQAETFDSAEDAFVAAYPEVFSK